MVDLVDVDHVIGPELPGHNEPLGHPVDQCLGLYHGGENAR